ncbi:hypothetical protein ANAPRD1_00947 [Anaplasma phagocytophilum]|uniref:hypothetical protein n=1 Tax=Anaplasma phagocytophilum TaxID=948 RepID=UPI0007E29E43|nr:hypothetical protein [Anaplasma phagocytophilum]SCV65884.1 hypothetical protein ANAPRD1_00947 [Anaplasma phagocytophilum]
MFTLKGAMNLFLRTTWASFFIRWLLRVSPRGGGFACISGNGMAVYVFCVSRFAMTGWVFVDA